MSHRSSVCTHLGCLVKFNDAERDVGLQFRSFLQRGQGLCSGGTGIRLSTRGRCSVPGTGACDGGTASGIGGCGVGGAGSG